MRPGGGKDKGGNYEREIGYKVSLWLSDGARKDVLCRTVGSGAQFTSSKQLSGIPGDLRSQHPLADKFCERFVIECKHWKDLDILSFLLEKGELYEALKKVTKEGTDLKRLWMLIARQNRKPDLLFIPVEALAACHYTYPIKLRFHAIFDGRVYMYVLDEFLSAITPEKLLGRLEERV